MGLTRQEKNIRTYGVVYFMQIAPGPIKIGRTYNLPCRWSQLQIANPYPLIVRGVYAGGEREECDLHHRFAASRIRGEWFEATPDLLAYIDAETESPYEHYRARLGHKFPAFRAGWPDFFAACVSLSDNAAQEEVRVAQANRVSAYLDTHPSIHRVSATQAARILATDRCHVFDLIEEGRLSVMGLGPKRLVDLRDVLDILEKDPIGA